MSRSFSPRKLLLPLVPVYQLAAWLRAKQLGSRTHPIRRLRFPVVSVGNLSTGGAGKTPLTIALVKALTARGLQVDVLSRGYGRKNAAPARVLPQGTAEEFGDEPLLIAQQTGVPVYVARSRFDAGLLSERDATIIEDLGEQTTHPIHLLDDGFQHHQLHRDIDILLLNRQDWEDRLLPAGNLREPLSAIRRATIVAIPAEDADLAEELAVWSRNALGWQGPVWKIRRIMQPPAVSGPVAAFCGIARPAQFFAGLEGAGLHLALRTVFPDHHPYTARGLERLTSTALAAGATHLLTTEKDIARLGPLVSALPASLPLNPVPLRIAIDAESQAIQTLIDLLGTPKSDPSL